MAKLVNLKRSKQDLKDAADAMTGPSSLATEGPVYPWGLSVTLDEDVLHKLGLATDDFTVGGTMTLIAKVDVTSVSSEERTGQDARQSVSLQITDLCLEDSGSKAAAAADALYGGKKG